MFKSRRRLRRRPGTICFLIEYINPERCALLCRIRFDLQNMNMRFSTPVSYLICFLLSFGYALAQPPVPVETAATAERQMNGVAAAQANRAPNNNRGKDETRLPFRILRVRLSDVMKAASGK
jgi:hypothetical protein